MQTTLDTRQIGELAAQLRVDSIRATTAAGSGHPTSSLSAADLMAVLLARHLRFAVDQPAHPARDHLIFSKGHASPLLYAMLKAMGIIGDDELLTLRQIGSRLEGHPVPNLPLIDVATGSLGQGLPIGVGVALAGRHLERLPYRVWVLLGDSEMAEGSMWEAFDKAGQYQLGNLVGILDMNRLGQAGPTALGWDAESYTRRAQAFGWDVVTIDGHDPAAIDAAYAQADGERTRPLLIVARTIKGKGVTAVENREGLHGKPIDATTAQQAIEELGGTRQRVYTPLAPPPAAVTADHADPVALPRYEVGSQAATRKAYGAALAALGARIDVVALDAEVSNSTYSYLFAEAQPQRFFEMWIAEQQMIAAAVGLSVRGYTTFASTFGAFLTRAYDFIRMAAVSRATIRLAGSHAGVAIGEDGPSQMALEDIAMMRAVYGSTVLYPCDANQTARLVEIMADLPGVSYLRTTRGNTPVIYGPDETFAPGGSKVLRRSDADQVTLIGAGVTVHEALAAADELAAAGIRTRVIDAYSIKPIDGATLQQAAAETGRLVIAEDHWPQGGLGEAVQSVFTDGTARPRIAALAVQNLPGSATPAEQLAAAGISAQHIAAAARRLI